MFTPLPYHQTILLTRPFLQGLPAELCIGVAKEGGNRLAAHAWVMSDGRVVIGGSPEDLSRYTRLTALEGKLP